MGTDLAGFMPLSIYERPDVSLANLLAGKPGAAVSALVQPDQLTPSQLKRLKDKFGDGKKHNPLIETILSISTNPLFLLGVALSFKFPPLSAKNLLAFSSKVTESANAMKPIFASIASPIRLFWQSGVKGKAPLWKLMERVEDAVLSIKTPYAKSIGKAIGVFEAKAGRQMAIKDWELVMMKLDGLDSMKGHLATGLKESGYAVTKPLLRKLNPATGFMAGHQAATDILAKDFFGSIHTQIGEALGRDPKAGQRLSKAIQQRFGVELSTGVYRKVGLYLPHMPKHGSWTRAETLADQMTTDKALMDKLSMQVEGGRKVVQEKGFKGLTSEVSPRGIARLPFAMVPDEEVLAKYKHLINPDTQNFLNQAVGAHRQHILTRGQGLVAEFGRQAKAGRIDDWKTSTAEFLRKDGHLTYNNALSQADDLAAMMGEGNARGASERINSLFDRTGNMPQYRLDPDIPSSYVNQIAPEFAWVTQGNGEAIIEATRKLDPYRQGLMKDAYIPLLRGRRTYEQNVWALKWATTEARFAKWLDTAPEAKKFVPDNVRKWVRERMQVAGGVPTSSLGGKIASYFYVTTLGMNPSPALKNLMQTFITTTPMMGAGATLTGFSEMMKRVPAYANARIAGKSVYDAMKVKGAFPEFIAANMEPAPLAEMMKHGAIGTEGPLAAFRMTASKAGRVVETAKTAMMKLFSTSEMTNRLVSFYGTRAAAMAEGGISAAKASELGRFAVQRTQFPAGVTGMPPALVNLPGVLRQFMYFPIRFMDFLLSPKTAGGGLGMLGRVAALSTAGGIAMKNLAGVDLEGGLAVGALPMPSFPGMPFHPWPLVPPIVGLAGGLYQAAEQGDMEAFQRAAALAVPGGIAGLRAYKALSPKFADYDNPTPDGKIPVYNKDQSLVGAFRPMQLYLKALGFRPTDMAKEQALTGYLLKQRDKIRHYRRLFIEALAKGDHEEAERIKKLFAEDYPEFGELTLKKSDVKAFHSRRTMSRIGRVIKGMPKEYKGLFQEMSSMATANEFVMGVHGAPDSLDILGGFGAPSGGLGGPGASFFGGGVSPLQASQTETSPRVAF